MANHRVAGVIVGEAKNQFFLVRQAFQFFRFRQSKAKRLITNDVDTRFQEFLRDLIVAVGPRNNDNRIDSVVLPLGFDFRHDPEIRVNPVLIDSEPFRAAESDFSRIPRKYTGNQSVFIIKTHRCPMGFGDPRARSAPNHSYPDSSLFFCHHKSCDYASR